MRMRPLFFSLACAAGVLSAASAAGLEVKLTVSDSAKVARQAGVVTCGVPLARGAVKDIARLSVWQNGRAIPAQFARLAPWDDGSARWVLMDCQADVPAGGKAELVLRDDGKNAPPAAPVKVADAASVVTVSTGPLQFTVDRKGSGLFRSIQVAGRELVTSAGGGLMLYTAGELKKVTTTPKGSGKPVTKMVRQPGKAVVAGPPTEVTVEQAGPMRAVVMCRGRYPGVHNNLLGYTVRITAFAGRRFLKLRVWLENHGRHGYSSHPEKMDQPPEWFLFDGMAVELGLGLGRPITASCEGVQASGRFKVLQVCKNAKERHDPAYGYANMAYTIRSGDLPAPPKVDPRRRPAKDQKPPPDPSLLKAGDRTDGVVTLSGPGGRLTAAVRHFWQNYEKAIELDGGVLKIWLWPTAGQYPRAFIGHACPGYANRMIHPLMKPGLYHLPGSVHKGHEMILDLSGRDPRQGAAELSEPLFALASGEYYAATEAAPGLFAPPEVRTGDRECNQKLDAWMRMTRSVADPQSKSSIWHARRDVSKPGYSFSFGYMYGWMDFGDLAVPGSGSVSLHYDWPWIVLVNALRTGDVRFMRLADEMMRHRVEVDQQWSDRALPAYRGFQRAGYTYAHFHCARFTRGAPNVVATWLPGVVLHYLMTGDAKTLECIRRSSAAYRPAWERIFTTKHYGTARIRGDMQAVARTLFAYCAMYALTAEKGWLDDAVKLFHRCVLAKAKEYGPHLHERNQIRSQDYTRDDVRYCFSLQAFCLLHHYTGDSKVFELLKAGCDTEFPENYFDAPLFLADLNAYVALKTGNADTLEKAVEHWICAFPESKCPPVYLSNNSQWSRRRAMLLRTGHLLQYAHWKLRKGK